MARPATSHRSDMNDFNRVCCCMSEISFTSTADFVTDAVLPAVVQVVI